MKKLLFGFLGTLLVLNGLSQVMPAGIKVTQTGLKVDSVLLVWQGKPVQLNPFPTGSKLVVALAGVRGFIVRDNKAFPGCSMKVYDKAGKVVLNYDDLFQDFAGGVSMEDAKFVEVSLPLGAPIIPNASYKWKVRVWDKNGKNELTAEIPITVSDVQDALGIKKVFNGLTCENAFIMMGTPLSSHQVKLGDELDFVLTGMKGFSIVSDKVRIGAGMSVKDKTGDVVLEYTDVFKGDDINDLKEAETLRLSLKIGDPLRTGNTYLWTIKIWDKISKKTMEASCSVEVR